MGEELSNTVEVIVDGTGHLGPLSYLVGSDTPVSVGDAVEVPFGKTRRHGLVIGPARHPERATKSIIGVWGPRIREADLSVAQEVADHYLTDLYTIVDRLSPSSGRGASATIDPEVVVADAPDLPDPIRRRRYLLHGPLDDGARIAAAEALRMSQRSPKGQVLILCPTVASVEQVLSHFASGAVRLDSRAAAGAWRGFLEGSVRVGIGTRAAALYSAAHLVGIIVVDESHPGHVESRSPYTSARDIAGRRAARLDCLLTLIGDNPSAASLGGGLKLQALDTQTWPTMRLVPRGDSGLGVVAPGPLVSQISRARRRGVTPTVIMTSSSETNRVCVRCGEKRPCTECGANSCRHRAQAPCVCGESAIRRVGWSPERITEVFGEPILTATIGELDRVHHAGLVVIFDVDGLLRAPGDVPESLAASVVLRAARAAGEGGTVCAVTSDPDHPLLSALFTERSGVLGAKRAWQLARENGVAPFGHTLRIWVGRPARPSTRGWPGQVYGPRRVRDEWEILVRIKSDEWDALAPYVRRLRERGKTRVRID